MKTLVQVCLIFIFLLSLPTKVRGELAGDPEDPDFIRATMLIAGPGEAMYQVTGHTMIRMECPSAGLDHIFSFESEDAGGALLALMKRVNGRFIAVETEPYLNDFKTQGREVVELPLNLQPRRKQRLWQVLDSLTLTDEHIFNMRNESCSGYILSALDISLAPARIEVIGGDIIGKPNALAIDSASLYEGPWRNLVLRLNGGEDNNLVDPLYSQSVPTNIDKDRDHYYIVEEGKLAVPLFVNADRRLTAPPKYYFTPFWTSIVALLLGVVCLVLSLRRRGRLFVLSVRWIFASVVGVAGILLAIITCTPSAIGGWANWNFLYLNPAALILMILATRTHRAYIKWWYCLIGAWLIYALLLPLLTESIVPAMSIFALASVCVFGGILRKN